MIKLLFKSWWSLQEIFETDLNIAKCVAYKEDFEAHVPFLINYTMKQKKQTL